MHLRKNKNSAPAVVSLSRSYLDDNFLRRVCGLCFVDVVEISSSEEEEEEDSDLIVMPSDADLDEDEDDDDDDDDVENSGSHVNDALNQRDAMGGVLVNVGRPALETDIFLAPQLAAVVKPHQVVIVIVLLSSLSWNFFGSLYLCRN